MKWFYDLKTSVKLISAFVLMAVILAFVGFFGLNNMGKINENVSTMYNDRLIPINDLTTVEVSYQQIRVAIRDMNTIAKTPEQKQKYKENINGLVKEIEAIMAKYSSTNMTKEEEEALKQFNPAWQAYNELLTKAIQLNTTNISAEEFTQFLLNGGFKESGDKLQGILENLVSINIKLAEKANTDGDIVYTTSKAITIAVIIAALMISIGLGYLNSQIIARPLNRMVKLVEQVAGGDLRETTDINTKDEIGQLAGSINDMVQRLRTTIGGILASAESVAAAAQQISASTEEIASGSNSQANDAQTMNELFKELSAAINSVAQSADQASELSNQTTGIAQEGGKVVRSSIEGMNRVNRQMSKLEDDSNKIGEIIEVIDDIAEQTNLLALNAAIEAARAGDQGRGFAVVADEVRKLAERSSEATKQITTIIKGMQENTQQSVKAVGEGVVLSQKTGEAFEQIITMVNESANRVTEIAAASEQQAAQSSEVLTSIESISASTEEAATASEETATTAQSLAGLAEELNHAVSIFRIK